MEKTSFYVSPKGCDSDSGKRSAPFQTIERARDAARTVKGEREIVLLPGEYYTKGIIFDSRDSGCSVRGKGEAVITGGVTVPSSLFFEPDPETKALLPEGARSLVKAVDLTKCGLSKEDWGEVYAIGSRHTAKKYDNGKVGDNIEIFSGGRRMHLSRYPNGNDFLKLEAVADVGDVAEFPPQNYYPDWQTRRNHRGGTYVMDRETNKRVAGWKHPESAWLFGYLYWDWADSSTPVRFKTENRLIFPEYVSSYAVRAGASYYFYNIPDELDEAGEFYLDRETGILLFYPFDDGNLEISLCRKPLIHCSDVCGMTFENLTFRCTCVDAMVFQGECNDNVIKGLTVTNVAGNAILLNGSRNRVEYCELSHTGKGGIRVTGGVRETLTPGENVIAHNYIHDYSEVYLTNQPGVTLEGVGNTCSHNEICRAPHMAIEYYGNDHRIEHNYIHETVLQSSDAGAIYSGFNWTERGSVIRHNVFENIGSGEFVPAAIYWDNGLSGQSAVDNLMINVKGNAVHLGGGAECTITDNVILDCGAAPVLYEDWVRDGFVNDGHARAAVNTPDSLHWKNLRAMPYTNALWTERYPVLARVKTDFAEFDDIDFPINPSYSVVKNNVIIGKDAKPLWCSESVYTYSTVEDNPFYASAEEAGLDLAEEKKKRISD